MIIGIDAPKTFRINPKTKTVDDIAEGYTDYVIWNRFRPECLDIDGDLPMECVDSGMVLLKGDIHDILGKVLSYAYGQIAPGAIPLLW